MRRIDGPVATVTLGRPDRRNALNRELLVALKQCLADLRMAVDIRVVVLTGLGPTFCAGVDISEDGRRNFYKPPQQIERLYQQNGQDIVRSLTTLPQVTIAAVNGAAIGWGACLTTCCDFRVASTSAFFRIAEIGLRMYYDVGCLYALLSLVGPAQTRRMTMLGEDIDATEAMSMGLVDRIASPETFSGEVEKMADALIAQDGAVLRVVKRQVYAGTIARYRHLGALELELTTAYYGANNDRHEGLVSFREHRAPMFSREPEEGTLTESV
ncbi:MAG: enoyl-CoA hydratase/isomerase family protein [Dehalococcoidia bacterium]|nr:enoyl-CoA hydratase/isomerase family protein [Dehalococcoidia bacterium]